MPGIKLPVERAVCADAPRQYQPPLPTLPKSTLISSFERRPQQWHPRQGMLARAMRPLQVVPRPAPQTVSIGRAPRFCVCGLPTSETEDRGLRRLEANRGYVAQVVAARTGLSQVDAEKRVNSVVNEAKTAADNTRRNAAHLSFWLTAALLSRRFIRKPSGRRGWRTA